MKRNQRPTHQGRKIKKYLISQSTFRKQLHENIPSHIYDKIVKAFFLSFQEYYNNIAAIDLPHITLSIDNRYINNKNINSKSLIKQCYLPYYPFTKYYKHIAKNKKSGHKEINIINKEKTIQKNIL
jgi:hypothetical protein